MLNVSDVTILDKVKIKLTPYQLIFYYEWLHNPLRNDYNIIIDNNIVGNIDFNKFHNSFLKVANEHFILSHNICNDDDGIYWKRREHSKKLAVYHPEELSDQEIYNIISAPFDLENDSYMRAHLIRLSKNKYRMILVFHHIAVDGVSTEELWEKIRKNYNDELYQIPSVEEQKKLHQELNASFTKLLEQYKKPIHSFWKKHLLGVDGVELKFLENEQGTTKSPRRIIDECIFSFDEKIYAQVKSLKYQYRVTPYLLGQITLAILLHKLTNKNELAIAYPVAFPEAKEAMYGSHINTMLIDYRFDKHTTLQSLIDYVASFFKELKQTKAKYLPINQIVQYADNPSILDVVFAQTFFRDHSCGFRNIKDENINHEFQIDFIGKLLVEQEEHDNKINYRVRFDHSVLDKKVVQQFIAIYQYLFNQVLECLLNKQANTMIKDLSLLDNNQKEKLVNLWRDNYQDDFLNQTIIDSFEMIVKKLPEHVALVYKNKQLSYRELNDRANLFAHYLKESYSLEANDIVALCMDRSELTVISMLAILKARAAYVPISPTAPDERIAFIVKDANARIILTNDNHQNRLVNLLGKNYSVEVVEQDVSKDLDGFYSIENLTTKISPQDLAYVIYTSGTTGMPKGVMIEHSGLMNLSIMQGDLFGLVGDKASKRCLWYSDYVFDAHASEVYTALVNGHTLFILEEEKRLDFQALQQYIQFNRIDIATIPPVLLDKDSLLALQTLVVAGDVTHPRIMDNYRHQGICVLNAYGPSEGTVCSSMHWYELGDSHTNIGRPLTNVTCYILNQYLEPVPVGVTGMLYIGGIGLARGYLNNPALTDEMFIVNPFQTNKEKVNHYNNRLYKTGDLARYTKSGHIEYMGRNDSQVKIRGFRIELEEIESRLLSHPQIDKVTVLVKHNTSTDVKLLVAYYMAGQILDESQLIAYLAQTLPDYMVPNVFVFMASFPLLLSGKIDRKALPEPQLLTDATYVAPVTEMEHKLCRLFAVVLGVEITQLGTEDDFFRLGGDSISGIQLVSRIRQQLGVNIGVNDIFNCRTIKSLCSHLSLSQGKALTKTETEQGILEGAVPLLPIQQWFFSKRQKGIFNHIDHWNQCFVLAVPQLCKTTLQKALVELINFHDAFRLSYEENEHHDFQVEQLYNESLTIVPIQFICEEGLTQQALDETIADLQVDFKLNQPPLLRVLGITDDGDKCIRLYFIIHHLIVDAVSWRIVKDDLQIIYNALSQDGEVVAEQVLGNKGSSYRQWSKAIAGYKSADLEAQVLEKDYWLAIAKKVITINPVLDANASSVKHEQTLVFDKPFTKKLTQTVHGIYNTQINDLLLCALALSLTQLTGLNEHAIALEGHGRESISDNLDVNNTVGWFTCIYPAIFQTIPNDIESTLVNIKDHLKGIPNNGIGYGALVGYSNNPLPNISFNYLGQFDGVEEQNWHFINDKHTGLSSSLKNKDESVLVLNSAIVEGKLQLIVTGSLSQSQLRRFMTDYQQQLVRLVDRLVDAPRPYLTLADIDYKITPSLLNALQSSREVEGIYLANSLQQGFIYHAISQGDEDEAYRSQLLWDYHVAIDADKLKLAWQLAQQKYPSLRLRFSWDETLIQIIDKKGAVDWRDIDFSRLSETEQQEAFKNLLEQDRKEVYDLTAGSLFRVYLIKCRDDYYRCIFNNHHAILDGWSNPTLLNFVHEAYLDLLLNQSITIKEDSCYLKAQAYLQQHKQIHQSYWKDYLTVVEDREQENLSALFKAENRQVVLSDHKKVKEPQEALVSIVNDQYLAMKEFCTFHGVTVNALLQYLWHKLLSLYSSSDVTVVGMTVAGRNLPIAEIEESVGLYINTLPIVLTHTDESVIALVKQLQAAINEGNNRSNVDLVTLQKSGERLFNTLFVYENYPMPEDVNKGDKLAIKFNKAIEKQDYPLVLTVHEAKKQVSIKIQYAGELFEQQAIHQLIGRFPLLLSQLLANQKMNADEFSYLQPEEYQQLVEYRNTDSQKLTHEQTITAIFAKQVDRYPEHIALKYQGEALSYRELNTKANQLALFLQAHYQLKANDLVALCLGRSTYQIIAILAVLKAGAAYVPMDPQAASERLSYMVQDTKAKVVLTDLVNQEHLQQVLTDYVDLKAIDDHKFEEQLALSYADQSPIELSRADDLAYIIYTSGTTGQPKGVMVEHRNVVNLFSCTDEYYHFNCQDVWTLFHSYTFDFSVWEIWGALFHGGKLVVSNGETVKDTDIFYDLCIAEGVTVLNQTPSAFYQFIEVAKDKVNRLAKLRYVIFGGEALNFSQLRSWYQLYNDEKPCLINMYGITETTVHVTYKKLQANNLGAASLIGHTLPSYTAYVLNSALQPIPIGVVGELYIGGHGVTRGYLNNPELTEQRFIVNPLQSSTQKSCVYNERLYKTGDLARLLADGSLEYIGRADFQVKIRGFRIELGEIEATLSSFEGIQKSVVLVNDQNNNKQLVAYYVSKEPLAKEQLVAYLQQYLPEYMIPVAFIAMESFPLTVNGKLDRHKMPSPVFTETSDYVPAQTELERGLCQIFGDVLGIDSATVGIEDDFFKLGGDSISCIQLINRIRQKFSAKVSVKEVFSSRTVKALAQKVLFEDHTTIISEQGILSGKVGLLPIQTWFFDQVKAGLYSEPNHWNQAIMINVPALNIDLLKAAIAKLLNYHDALRLVFKTDTDEAIGIAQHYQEVTKEIQFTAASVEDYPTSEQLTDLFTKWQSGFSLEQGQLYHIGYLSGYGDGRARLHIALHHLLVDAVSLRIIKDHLESIYLYLTEHPNDMTTSAEQILGRKGTSYRQWGDALGRYADAEKQQASYWQAIVAESDPIIKILAKKKTEQTEIVHVQLTASETKQVLRDVHEIYHTQINDLLLTALALSLEDCFHLAKYPVLLEGHGREEIANNIDINRTVGWFTSFYPVLLPAKAADSKQLLVTIKDQLRTIPGHGIGYGVLEGYCDHSLPNIAFNYLGNFSSHTQSESWRFVDEQIGTAVSVNNKDNLLLNINGLVIDNVLTFSIASQLPLEQLTLFAKAYKQHLQNLVNVLLSETRHYLTPSDIDKIISKDLLDRLQAVYELDAVYKANSLQQGFVYHALVQGNKDEAYRTQMVWEYHRELDESLLKQAWLFAQKHYPTLRLRFSWDEDIVQVVDKQSTLTWDYIDLTDLDEFAQANKMAELIVQDKLKAYDLGISGLFRITLIKQKINLFTCIFNNHHAVLDGWSNPVLITFIHDIYLKLLEGKCPDLTVDKSYLDAQIYLQNNRQHDKDFWDSYLAQLEEAEDLSALIKPELRPLQLSDYKYVQEPKEQELIIELEDYRALKLLSQQQGITINALMQYCWHKQLSVYGNSQTTVLGMTVSGRNLPVDGIEQSVGLYINTLPVVLNHSEKLVVEKLVELQDVINEVNNRSHVELVKLQKNGQRLFNSLFIFENYPSPDSGEENPLGLCFKTIQEKMDYPLAITAYEADTKLVIKLRYAGELFTEQTIADLLAGIHSLLSQLLANPFINENSFQYLTSTEYNKVLIDWNNTLQAYPKDKTIADIFAQQAALTPDAVAIKHQGTHLTYQQLDEQTNLLAHHLNAKYQVKSDDIVAICLNRSPLIIVSVLAILKAGGAYVPMDIHAPGDRFAYILDQTKAKAVITDQANVQRFNSLLMSSQSIELVDDQAYWDHLANLYATSKVCVDRKPSDLAYVLFTSGTTGNPKGVMIEQRSYINLIYHYRNTYFRDHSKVDTFSITNYVFDIWGLEYGLPLFTGGVIELASSDFEAIETTHYSFIQMTPSVWSACIDKITFNNPRLYILVGGEPVTKQLLDKFFTGHELFGVLNVYGPTETTIWSTTQENTVTNHSSSIGRPINNTSIYVLNAYQQPVPVGVLGELYIGGDGVARGYLNNPSLTRQSFINNPYQSKQDQQHHYNERLYKTGDLVRYLPDGRLEFIGRNDFQVKIRGFRIELGEIESRLTSYPTVKQAIVVAKEHRSGNKYLVAYYLTDRPIEESQLREYLSQYLADYMMPAIFIGLTAFPLTPSGKVNRKALPEADFEADEQNYVAPTTSLEENLSLFFAQVLGLSEKKLSIEDSFFALGGDSILVIKLVNQINKSGLGYLQLGDIFNYPTVKMLARCLQEKEDSPVTNITMSQTAVNQEYILSSAQERLWFIEQYEKGSNAYNIPMVFKLKKQVSIKSIQLALQTVINRHEVLRTIIKENDHGEGYQKVLDYPLVTETVHVTSQKNLDVELEKSINYIFNLAFEYPIKAKLYQLFDEHYMSIVVHHIAFDGWSTDVFINEIINHYYYFESVAIGAQDTAVKYQLPRLTLQYKDYAQWQKNHLTGEFLNKQKAYWINQLADFEVLNLPTDKVRPPQVSYQGEDFVFELDPLLSEALQKLAKKLGVTLYSVLLSAYYLLLSAFSNQKDIVVGTPIANRNYSEIEHLIGFFVNTLALRQQIDKTQTVECFIKTVGQAIVEAQEYQELPFERLVEELNIDKDPSRHPIFQVTFGMEFFGKEKNKEVVRLFEPYQEITPKIAKFDLSLMMTDLNGRVSGTFNYATALFNQQTIDSFSQTFKELLTQFSDATLLNQPIKELSYVSKEQFNKIIYQWNATDRPYPSDKTLVELFESQVVESPERVALVCEDCSLSYRELNTRANQLAYHLLEQYEVTPNTIICLYLDRTEHMVVSMLAILKVGGAYAPIDPAAPKERVSHIINETSTKCLLTNTHYMRLLVDIVDLSEVALIEVDSESLNKQLNNNSSENLNIDIDATQLAYIIYTSGTTGSPKGVMIEHVSAINFIMATSYRLSMLYDSAVQKRCLWISNYVFDAHIYDVYGTILNGNCLYVLTGEQRTDLLKIKEVVKENKINFGYIPPVLLDKENIVPLQKLVVAGEIANAEVIESYIREGIKVFNLYGPTEISVGSHFHLFRIHDKNTNIGQVIFNNRVYITDENMKLLPIGAVGEIYIGGVGVSQGYLNNSQLTAERFLLNPFQTKQDKQLMINQRVYKTGDLAKYLSNGDIEYIGRNDFQVKIRGLRIELAEIETHLSTYLGIQKVVVLTRQYASGDSYIAAYYVANNKIDKDLLNEYLSQFLPDYMLPSSYIHMDDFPYTLNGKLDRRKLPDPLLTGNNDLVLPSNEVEEQFRVLFAEVLKLEVHSISVESSFFELGGNSILVIKLANLINKTLNKNIPVSIIFTHKTVKKLGRYWLQNEAIDRSVPVPVVVSSPEQQLLSFAQQRLWFIETFQGGGNAYNVPVFLELKDSTNIDIFIQALRATINRHHVLRSVIKKSSEGVSYQEVIDDAKTPLEVHELSLFNHDELKKQLSLAISHVFRLDSEYPIRVTLYQVSQTYYISIVIHHIAFDGWSADILIKEIYQFYQYFSCIKQGEEATQYLPKELPIQYKDYALWQRSYLASDSASKQLSFWKNKLVDFSLLDLPLDKPRPTKINYVGGSVAFTLSKQVSDDLRGVARILDLSLNSLLLSGYYLVLMTYANQDDIVLGIPVANRNLHEVESLVGFFVNSLALRQKIDREKILVEFIKEVGESVTEAQLHQDLPFDLLVSELQIEQDVSRNPIFQVMFSLQSFGEIKETGIDELVNVYNTEEFLGHCVAKFDLTTMMDDSADAIQGVFNYATSLFNQQSIMSYIETYTLILEQFSLLIDSDRHDLRVCDLMYVNSNSSAMSLMDDTDWSEYEL